MEESYNEKIFVKAGVTMTEYEFKEWFKAEWTKITEELKGYNLSNMRIVGKE